MDKVELNKLFLSINHAVINANETMRKQYAEILSEYFDEQNKPIHVELELPVVHGTELVYKNVAIPKLSLVPLSMMKVKEVTLNLQMNMSQLQLDTKDIHTENNDKRLADEPIAHIEIKMESTVPPEGVLKINDYLINQLP